MIIGVSGKMYSGKDTFKEIAKSYLLMNKDMECSNFSFGKRIKEITAYIFGIEYSEDNDRAFKEETYICLNSLRVVDLEAYSDLANAIVFQDTEFDSFFKYMSENYATNISKPITEQQLIIINMRIWLQYFGTDIMRSHIPNVWVSLALNEIAEDRYYICTDVRCVEEAEAIKARGGIIVRVNRNSSNIPSNEHSTETNMDSYNHFDYVIDNDGTLTEFSDKVKEVLQVI